MNTRMHNRGTGRSRVGMIHLKRLQENQNIWRAFESCGARCIAKTTRINRLKNTYDYIYYSIPATVRDSN
jgi:hypothetical protein